MSFFSLQKILKIFGLLSKQKTIFFKNALAYHYYFCCFIIFLLFFVLLCIKVWQLLLIALFCCLVLLNQSFVVKLFTKMKINLLPRHINYPVCILTLSNKSTFHKSAEHRHAANAQHTFSSSKF